MLDADDWYGVTVSCDVPMAYDKEPNCQSPGRRLFDLSVAHEQGIKTWISFEPVLEPNAILSCIDEWREVIDKVKIGKLNYSPSNIDWAKFGRDAEALCKKLGLDYYIKDSLRAEMNKARTEETTRLSWPVSLAYSARFGRSKRRAAHGRRLSGPGGWFRQRLRRSRRWFSPLNRRLMVARTRMRMS